MMDTMWRRQLRKKAIDRKRKSHKRIDFKKWRSGKSRKRMENKSMLKIPKTCFESEKALIYCFQLSLDGNRQSFIKHLIIKYGSKAKIH